MTSILDVLKAAPPHLKFGAPDQFGRKVFVYWNLHHNCFSVQDAVTRLIVAHRHCLSLDDVTFRVSQAGRERVLREKCKNVHAGILGTWVSGPEVAPEDSIGVSYNPYAAPTFVRREDKAPVVGANTCLLAQGRVYARGLKMLNPQIAATTSRTCSP